MFSLIAKLYELLDAEAKARMPLLLVFMVVASLLEACSIGMVLLFIGAVNESLITNQSISGHGLNTLYAFFGLRSTTDFFVILGCALVIIYILKNVFLYYQSYRQNMFIYQQQARISKLLMDYYLTCPYTYHIQHNSAEMLRNVTSSTETLFGNGIVPVISILAELFVVAAISIFLIIVEPLVTVCAFVVLGLLVVIFFKMVRKKVSDAGHAVQELARSCILWTNQSLGGIKEIKILGRESFFLEIFSRNRNDYARELSFVATLQRIPRLYLEVMLIGGMLLTLVVLIIKGTESRQFIPIVGIFAMASVRLMPSISQITSSLNSLKFGTKAIEILHKDIMLIIRDNRSTAKNEVKALPFNNEILLENITYCYPDSSIRAVDGISLSIPFGTSVAFVGQSGSGKTTIVDVILGLLKPSHGTLRVDGVNVFSDEDVLQKWQRNTGYVPQTIYLLDDTLRRNIALGIKDEEIDDLRIQKIIGDVHLDEFIAMLPEGLGTRVGERGVRLSGGQRQRIGIARALYHDPAVLVLDEATSSLDSETESEISLAIDALSGRKTIIIIAHRLSTVNKCKTLFFLKGGVLTGSGTFTELSNKNREFRTMIELSKTESNRIDAV